VRYGEIGIKSRSVRGQFERRLVECIEDQLVRRKVEAETIRGEGRIFVRSQDTEGALDALRHTFGVVNASPAIEMKSSLDEIASAVVEVARAELAHGAGFAVRVKRAGQHTFTSLDVAKACASRILGDLEERKPHVALDAPDWEVHVEVREDVAYVFRRKVPGPGGLPLGSQGRVGILVEGPRAAHAGWLLGKRGASLYFYASDMDAARVWLAPLEPWIPALKLREIEGATRQERYQTLRGDLDRQRCHALVVADDLAKGLASAHLDASLGFPVFRPLTGYPGARLNALARLAELPEDPS
jgi:thiamine biosynthesis protein ThiI